MKVLVINLDRETRRLDFQTAQLKKLGLQFERVPAFKIQNKESEIFQKHYKTWQRPLSISEVSCFFSHKKTWEIVASQTQPILILEDDAWLDENIACILDNLTNQKNIDYVSLEITGGNRKKLLANVPKAEFCDTSLFQLFQGRAGAGGYVLWPSGAKKLLDKANRGKIGLADKFINALYTLNSFHIEPAAVIQLDQCKFYNISPPLEVQTTIVNKFKSTHTLFERLLFKKRRIIGEIKIGLNYLKHSKHATRRRIALSDFFKER